MFKDKIAVFTGAGSGIGAAASKAFAAQRATVIVTDMVKENAEKTVAEARADGGKAFSFVLDVTDKSAVDLLVDQVVKEFGGVDILMNSAGISKIIPTVDCSEKTWDLTLDVNLKGTFLCCQAVIVQMLKQGKGIIINMSSQSGKKAGGQYAAYCASKFGVIGLTQSLAVEFARSDIRVNAICPGVVETPMWDSQRVDYAKKREIKPEDVMAYFRESIPLGRLCRYEDISELALFLASEKSGYMTGQAINLTGGSIMF